MKITVKNPEDDLRFKERSKEIGENLYKLQQKIREEKLPVIILVEGWGASGKGTAISDIIKTLDPRFFSVKSTMKANEIEKRYPLMKRFWDRIPSQGNILILNRSWYQETAIAYLEDGVSEQEFLHRLSEVKNFERQLVDDGYAIIKIFLHISKSEQNERFVKLKEKNHSSWKVSKIDELRHKHYKKYKRDFTYMISQTDSEFAKWNVIDATDREETKFNILSVVEKSILEALENKPKSSEKLDLVKNFELKNMPKLSEIKLSGKEISYEDYKAELKAARKKLAKLHDILYKKKIPVVIGFEGWDAAGKGGAIRRVTSALDPRGYEAIPVSAPSSEEISRHYLWRFWNKLPKSGHIALFDRTWYGRVMVEKIEKFTPLERLENAFYEINEFEQDITDYGAIVMKFYLHIDKEEQLKRFNLRENTPEKKWKITDEDWRNREKWDEYEKAIDEMIEKTSTEKAPWFIIESNDKRYARIKIMKTIIKQIEDFLEE